MQLPGRENRLREAPFIDLADLLEGLLPGFLATLDRPYAVFGHSLGALVAYEIARRAGPRQAPVQIFLSGRRAPQIVDPLPPITHLPDAEFIASIQARYGGIPQAILEETELMALFLPTLRADVRLLENYTFTPGISLDCPVTVLGGTQDPTVLPFHLDAWQDLTRGPFDRLLFPGGHFYLQEQRPAVLNLITRRLAPETCAS